MSETSLCRNHQLNIYTGFHVGTFNGHSEAVTKICTYSPEDNRIVSTSADKSIFIWRLGEDDQKITGFNILSVMGHDAPISDGSLSRNYGLLSTSSYDKTVKVWDMNMGKCQRTFLGHTDHVLCVTFDEGEQRVISGSRDKSARLWDIYCKDVWTNTKSHDSPITCVNLLRNQPNCTFITASDKGDLLQWDLLRFTSNRQYIGHVNRVNSISVSVDSVKMMVGGEDEDVTIWNIGTYKQYERFIAKGVVRSVSISPMYYICAVGEEEKILMYHFCSSKSYQTLLPQDSDRKNPPKVTALCWSDDSMYLYAGYNDGKIRVYRFKKLYVAWHKKEYKEIRTMLYT